MSRPRAVVVGSGIGGLAAALRLAARGYAVRVLEALDRPGGRARVFRQDGFVFDAGPTVITAPVLFDELFARTGARREAYVEFVPVDPYYRVVFHDGATFDYVGDEERLLAQIRAFEPRDVDGYRRLVALVRRIYRAGYLGLGDRPFLRKRDMLPILPAMVRLRSYRSVYGLVRQYLRDERLRRLFSFESLLIGGHPFRVPSLYLLIHWLERAGGVWFARGGTGALVAAMVRRLEELGGELVLEAPVDAFEFGSRTIRAAVTADGRRWPADLVVANADPLFVYRHLVPPERRPGTPDRRLRRVRTSMGLFVLYFGTRRLDVELAHHTVWLGPRYRGLLDDLVVRHRLPPDDLSVYLHAPTRTDASLAPAGHDGFYVLAPVPNLRAGIDWACAAAPLAERLYDQLERTLLPGLRAARVTQRWLTPADFAAELRSVDGAAFGPEPLLRQSAAFRFPNRCPDISNLFFVGAGTHPGAGLPGVVLSARVLDRLLGPVPGLPPLVPLARLGPPA